MATYYSNLYGTTIRQEDASSGRVVTFAGSLVIPSTKVVATGDVLKLFKVGSGGHVRNVWLQNTDFGTDVPGTFGHFGVDDGVAIDADSIVADIVLETAADRNFENYASDLTSAGSNFATPFATLTEDASFDIVVGTVVAGAAGTINFSVEVAFFGNGAQPVYTWNRTNLGAVST